VVWTVGAMPHRASCTFRAAPAAHSITVVILELHDLPLTSCPAEDKAGRRQQQYQSDQSRCYFHHGLHAGSLTLGPLFIGSQAANCAAITSCGGRLPRRA